MQTNNEDINLLSHSELIYKYCYQARKLGIGKKCLSFKSTAYLIKQFNYLLKKKLSELGLIRFPHDIGAIQIVKRPIRQKKVLDYNHYKKTGEVIFHLNLNQDMCFYKCIWLKGSQNYTSYYTLDIKDYDLKNIIKNINHDKCIIPKVK